jgi:hypothetical protein
MPGIVKLRVDVTALKLPRILAAGPASLRAFAAQLLGLTHGKLNRPEF